MEFLSLLQLQTIWFLGLDAPSWAQGSAVGLRMNINELTVIQCRTPGKRANARIPPLLVHSLHQNGRTQKSMFGPLIRTA